MQEQISREAAIWYQSVNWQGVINRMAESLGTTGEYLWEVLVHGTVVNGIAGLISLAFFAVFFGTIGFFGLKQLKSMPYEKDFWNEKEWSTFWLTGVIPMLAFMIATVIILSHIKGNIMQIGAPEYEALRFLITEAKQ